ncbi:MAG: Sapep family Mn(2+)-dependent dipeptidase [Christensenellaceae bacterium]|jgi:succinyl-diaminopimelate desuccinylase|nr:Sapep family Mn(2+)-dependent dipeptidase [Christensenellaceae bacterium]
MIKADFSTMIKTLQALLKIESVESSPLPNMPFGKNCAEALEFVLRLLCDMGFRVKNLDNYCGYAEIGEGELFGILGHLDVVPAGNGWTYPPFGATLVDGKLFSRGAIDDKGPTVACIYAVARLINEGRKPKKRLRFILGCDEESGWKCMERYSISEEMPIAGFSPDADFPVINCEKGVVHYTISIKLPKGIVEFSAGTRTNVVADLSLVKVESSSFPSLINLNSDASSIIETKDNYIFIKSCGISAHASRPEEGVNALLKSLHLLSLDSRELKCIHNAFSKNDGSGCKLDFYDEKSGALTLNLATAEIKADVLSFTLDIRFPVSCSKDEIIKILKSTLPFAEITQDSYHLPLYVAEDAPLVKTLLAAYDRVMGSSSKPITIGGGTYARVLPLGVAFGPVFPNTVSTVHQKDEFISLSDLALITEIYYQAIKDLVF